MKEKQTGEEKRRKKIPPLFGLVNFRLAGLYFQRSCLLINDYYDDSPERSSVG